MERDQFESVKVDFPFLHMEHHEQLTLGEFLLHVIYRNISMETLGVGVFAQTHGFTMGTSAAPVWAILALRAFEKQLPLSLHMCMSHFIDDGFVLHFDEDEEELVTKLHAMYPVDLKVEFEKLNTTAWIPYMDCMSVSLEPRCTTIHYKKTHSCSHMLWGSNTPRHIRMGWLHAECVQYLRICSRSSYHDACVARQRGAIRRLNYPISVADSFKIPWD